MADCWGVGVLAFYMYMLLCAMDPLADQLTRLARGAIFLGNYSDAAGFSSWILSRKINWQRLAAAQPELSVSGWMFYIIPLH